MLEEGLRFPNPIRFLRSMGEAASRLFRGRKVMADPDTVDVRREICGHCGHNLNGQCDICTCHIGLKTLFKHEKCPLERWK